ncbi:MULTISPECIES: ABC transporter ATP-binding protein [Priestia]|uniref:ABC transporter ATP-binding protein n=1 Tax=Priestia TaxID=2800373 RepID=UPI0027E2D1FC|nr:MULTISPECIES: ABC transporter ATP-binding protein [Priestia]MDY0939876.1 ABC transporter ATP-binding protein [Priestia megaterium]
MNTIKSLYPYLKPYKWLALFAPLLMVIEVLADLLQPTIMQHIIDYGIANNNQTYVITRSILMLMLAIIGLAAGIVCAILSTKAAVNFSTDIRKSLFEKIENLSNSNRDKLGTGHLITVMTNDVTSVQNALNMTLKVLVRGPLLFAGSIVIVLLTARSLFPIIVVVVPILFLCIWFVITKAGKLFKKVQQRVDRVNTKVQENLSGMRVVKAYVRESYEINQFKQANNSLTRANMSAVQLISLLMPVILFVVNIGMVATLWLGGLQVEADKIEAGVILAFINYLTIILNGLMSSSMVLMQITRAFPSAERIDSVLKTKIDIPPANSAAQINRLKGDLSFQNVTYSYSKNGENVLKDISFTARHGETIGIIGSTGSGKSTLAKLISRLYDPDDGQIFIDGKNLTDYDVKELRLSIGFIPQKATLFTGTIDMNIRMGKEHASSSEIEDAAGFACATEFIEKLPEKYDYPLTRGATNLSGGQKQRLSIARAFVRKPAILVIDDATSALDAVSEAQVLTNLKEEFSDATVIIIASKISSLLHTDHIIVMDEGKIAEQGTHEELLRHRSLYYDIYLAQGGKEVLPSE